MAVYQTVGNPVWAVQVSTSFSAFHYPSADPFTIAVNQNDSIVVWAGSGTFLPGGQPGGDAGITVTDSDNNHYTFVKAVSSGPHINVAYLFTAFNVNANAALTVTITGGTPVPFPSGPGAASISTVTNLINPSGFSFGSSML
jgi:hypothetical protein